MNHTETSQVRNQQKQDQYVGIKKQGGKADNPQSMKQLIKQLSYKDEQRKQNLNLSDYQAFLIKSKQNNKSDYPSNFKFISIISITDSEIKKQQKQHISALSCTRLQLIDLATSMIMQNDFAKKGLMEKNIKALLTAIAQNYNTVSYHNFSHGFSLMQMLFKCFKLDEKLRQIYCEQDLTFYLLAGIAHDLNHKGTNNGYEVKLETELAKVAQNVSVLEKMHIRTLFQITRSKPEYDLLSRSKDPKQTKQKITRVILATDMAKHDKKLEEMKRMQINNIDFKQEEDKIVLMQSLIHACDIGNGLLPFEQYLSWAPLLSYEFNEQTKSEAQHDVPVTGFLKYTSIAAFYDDQIGFMGRFVLPLWKEIGNILPHVKILIDSGQQNLQKIKQLKESQKY